MMDLVPQSSALETLVFHRVCDDDHMHDYSVHQAYRSCAYSMTRDDASCADLLRSLSLLMVRSGSAAAAPHTAAYIAARLALEEGSSHGEGNAVPDVKCLFAERLHRFAETLLSKRSASASHSRKVILGFAMLVRAMTQLLSATVHRRRGGFLVASLPELHSRLIHVCGLLAVHAEGVQDPSNVRASDPRLLLSPCRVTVECNATVLVVLSECVADVVSADMYSAAPKPKGSSPPTSIVAIDTGIEPLLWSAAQWMFNAASRHVRWLELDVDRLKNTDEPIGWAASASSDEDAAAMLMLLCATGKNERWLVRDLLALWANSILPESRKKHEFCNATALQLARDLGSDAARDVRTLRDASWRCSVRTCMQVVSLVRGCAHTCCGLAPLPPGPSDALLHSIASLLLERLQGATPQAGNDADEQPAALAATLALLDALSQLLFVCPLLVQQEQLWRSNPQLTSAIHGVVLQRAMRHTESIVVRLGSMLSTSILGAGITAGADSSLMDVGGDQLLDLLRTSEGTADGAAEGAVQMVVLAAVARPHAVIPSLFALLKDKSSNAACRNALSVLTLLPRFLDSELSSLAPRTLDSCKSLAPAQQRMVQRAERVRQAQADKRREALRILAEHLIDRIGEDEVLEQRMRSASLFEVLIPQDVAKPLLLMSIRRDATGRRRGAATRALAALVFRTSCVVEHQHRIGEQPAHPVIVDGLIAVIHAGIEVLEDHELLLNGSGEGVQQQLRKVVPQSPADIYLQSQLHTLAQEDIDADGGDLAPSSSPASGEVLFKKVCAVIVEGVRLWVQGVLSTAASRSLAPAAMVWLVDYLSTVTNSERLCSKQCTLELAQQLAMRCLSAATAALLKCMAASEEIDVCRIHALLFDWCRVRLCSIADGSYCKDTLPQDHGDAQQQRSTSSLVFDFVYPLALLKNVSSKSLYAFLGQLHTESSPSVVEALIDALYRCCFDDTPTNRLGGYRFLGEESIQKLALEVLCGFPEDVVLRVLHYRGAVSYFEQTSHSISQVPSSVGARAFLFLFNQRIARHFLGPGTVDDNDAALKSAGTSIGRDTVEQVAQWVQSVTTAFIISHALALPVGSSDSGVRFFVKATQDSKIFLSALQTAALLVIVSLREPSGACSDLLAAIQNAVATYFVGPMLESRSMLNTCEDINAQLLVALEVLQASIPILKQQPSWVSTQTGKRVHWSYWWGRVYLQPLMAVANKAVTFAVDDSKAAAAGLVDVATRCIKAVFAFVMMMSTSSAAAVESNLDTEDEDAIVSFACGCIAYDRLPGVQFEGTKLVASVMAVFGSQWSSPTEPSQAAAGRVAVLERMMRLLSRVALLHPIPEARQLAESVLESLSQVSSD